MQPDFAVFGKKDRQQLKLVRGMVQQFNLPIQIVPGETVRADDGLALSSRNNYLSPVAADEKRLVCIERCGEVADAIASGRTRLCKSRGGGLARSSRGTDGRSTTSRCATASGLRIPHPEGFDHPDVLIVLGAATFGTTRLIDNVDVIRKDGED